MRWTRRCESCYVAPAHSPMRSAERHCLQIAAPVTLGAARGRHTFGNGFHLIKASRMELEPIRTDPIPTKRRPGRPRLLSPAYEDELAGVTSTHGAQGRHYATVAVRALFALEQPAWVPRDEAFAHFVKR